MKTKKIICLLMMVAAIITIPIFNLSASAADNTHEATAVSVKYTMLVDGKDISVPAFTINGGVYFKLRDIAMMLDNTGKQFAVNWNGTKNTVSLTTGSAYTPVGGELASAGNGMTATPNESEFYIDGRQTNLSSYSIDGYHYVKLTDMANALGFTVTMDAASSTAAIGSTQATVPAGPFQAIAGDLLTACDFPVVLPGYLPSTPGGNGYEWSIMPNIKSDTYSIDIYEKKPDDTLGIFAGSLSGNTGEPSAQLESQFENGNIKANDISLSNGIQGKEFVQDSKAYGGTAIAWKIGEWSFFVDAGPEDTINNAEAYADQIIDASVNRMQMLPGVQGKFCFIHNGNMPLAEISWESKTGVWYTLDWQDPVNAAQMLQNMVTVDDTAQIWKNGFYQSVGYDPDKNLLSFTIPNTVPDGYRFYLHVSGRLFMGDQSSGTSFHAFDEESLNFSWVNGKTYTYPLDSGNLDFCLLTYGLVDNNGQETLYHITILPNGTKAIVKDDS